MSREPYTPDRWVLVQVPPSDTPRVLAGWVGGYGDADHWRLSSGVERVEEDDEAYTFTNLSGSVYVCHKTRVGLTALTTSILTSLGDNVTVTNQPKMNIPKEVTP